MEALMNLVDINMCFENNGTLFGKKQKVRAVTDIKLHINPGEIIAIVGESGCGKTTIGKMVTGLFKPTGGHILFQGKDIWSLGKKEFEEYRKGVQMVHQDSYAALNPARTIYQSLSAPILQHRIVKNHTEARNRMVELLTLVGLTPPEQFLDKYPHQLSGGQRQRILLARALSVQPKLIVADEPVSMVDVSIRISLLDLMARMNEEFKIAFIYITHDLATARYIAGHGRIAVMYLGKIVETGSLNQVIEAPKHPYLQALLSAVPIPEPRIARNMKPLPLKSLDMPSAINPPKGCRFHPRCPYAEKRCEVEEPVLRELDGEMVACHLAGKIPEWKLER